MINILFTIIILILCYIVRQIYILQKWFDSLYQVNEQALRSAWDAYLREQDKKN